MFKPVCLRLAWQTMVRNYRVYLPFLLGSCFIVMLLSSMHAISEIRIGGDNPYFMDSIVRLGNFVILVFSAFCFVYLNGFLERHRQQEHGLFCVLGLEKKHLKRIVFYQLLIMLMISLAVGLIFGVVLVKIMVLLVASLLHEPAPMGYTVSLSSMRYAALVVSLEYALMYWLSCRQIQHSDSLEMLFGQNGQQQEPKSRLGISLLGLASLFGGYYLAFSARQTITAIFVFIAAVFLVILGTYCLFVSGSITLLRLMEKNKRYYYKTANFLNVSNMKYRMKQNAVSLANICILSTMILVALSTTAASFAGIRKTIDRKFPDQWQLRLFSETGKLPEQLEESKEILNQYGLQMVPSSVEGVGYYYLMEQNPADGVQSLAADQHAEQPETQNPDESQSKTAQDSAGSETEGHQYLLAEQDPQQTGAPWMILQVLLQTVPDQLGLETPEAGSVIVYQGPKGYFEAGDLLQPETMPAPLRVQAVRPIKELNLSSDSGDYSQTAVLIVSDPAVFETLSFHQHASLSLSGKEGTDDQQMYSDLIDHLADGLSMSIRSRDEAFADMTGAYGTVLFVGICISVLLLVMIILIVYYKQISEGYEDKRRYQILTEVGLERKDVRKLINTQALIMFFLPLAAALMHIFAAYPLIVKILRYMTEGSSTIFLITTILCTIIFAIVYLIIYKLTARIYMSIVLQH